MPKQIEKNPQDFKIEEEKEKTKNKVETPETLELPALVEDKFQKMEDKQGAITSDENKIEGLNRVGLSGDSFKNLLVSFKLKEKLKNISDKGKTLLNRAKEKINEIIGIEKESYNITIPHEQTEVSLVSKEKERSKLGEKEIFIPEVEIRNLRTGSLEERKQKLAELKDGMIEQKRGVAEIQNRLFEKIKENPDAPLEDYIRLVHELGEKYKLRFDHREAFVRAMEKYLEKHKLIGNFVSSCRGENGEINQEMVYEKLFNRKPVGQIQVLVGSAMIYLKISNIEDYAYVRSNAYLGNKTMEKEDINMAKMSGGINLDRSLIGGLDGSVVLENGSSNKSGEINSGTVIHEEQHVWHRLVHEGYNPEMSKLNKAFSSDKLKDNEIGRKEKQRDIFVEQQIKDEILAYFIGGNSPFTIRQILLQPETIYDYGFKYAGRGSEKKEFSKKYIDLVEKGIIAYESLLKSGYSPVESKALLEMEPLTKWPKVVRRLTGERKTDEQKIKDRESLLTAQQLLDKLESDPERYADKLSGWVAGIEDRDKFFKLLEAIKGVRLDFKTGQGRFGAAILNQVADYLNSPNDKDLLEKIPEAYGFRAKAKEIFIKEKRANRWFRKLAKK